jgi:hypothetical protein
MHRIDSRYVVADLFGAGKDGFTNGTPGILAPTEVTADFINALQEETCAFVARDASALVKGTNTQLLSALISAIAYKAAAGTWSELGAAKNVAINGVAHDGAENFVMVGENDGTDPYILYSADGGVTWTEVAIALVGGYLLNDVAYDGSTQFLAVGNEDGVDSLIATSVDGILPWTVQTPPAGNFPLYSVRHDQSGLWVAVGGKNGTHPHIMTSASGTAWTIRTPTVAKNLDLYAVAHNGLAGGDALWMAVGEKTGTGPYRLTSPDGITWTAVGAAAADYDLNAVAHNGRSGSAGLWVAVGEQDTVFYSPDGTTWTAVNVEGNSTASYNSVVFAEGAWIAVGDVEAGKGPVCAVSADGITWKKTYIGEKDFALNSVVFAEGKLIAAGAADGTDPYMLQSNVAVPRW